MADNIGEVCHMFYVSIQFKNGIVVVLYAIDEDDDGDEDSAAKKRDGWRLALPPHLTNRFGCFIRVMIGLIRVLLTVVRCVRIDVLFITLYDPSKSELRFYIAKKIPEVDYAMKMM